MKGSVLKSVLIFIFSIILTNIYSQNTDIDLLRRINLDRNRYLDNTFRGITNSAGVLTFGTPAIMCGIGLLKHDSLTVRNAIYIGASVAVGAILTTIVKYSVNRPRPFVTYSFIEKETGGGSPSFPSGHTSEAFSLATSLSLAYPKWYIITPSFIWAGAVGYSRMDLGVHYPSDVLAGAVLGAGSAWLTYEVNKKLKAAAKPRHLSH